jgi:lipopolysaccharide transport system ATP-binding protein
MVVRLAFAVLVHIEPEILIIDEALAVGDFLFQQKCFDHLRKFQERGCTFLFVSHSMSTVLDLCGRAMLLEKGRLKFDGPAKEAVDLYEGSVLQDRYADRGGAALRMHHQQAVPLVMPVAAPVPAPSEESQRALSEAEEAMLAGPEMAEPDVGSLVSENVRLGFVRVYGADGVARDWVTSEEEITLAIGIVCHVPLDDPHIGFKIRDKLGRVLFETSSLCMGRHVGDVSAGEVLVSRFRFAVPLHAGEYSVTVGFANGAVGPTDYREALLFQHGAKTFEVVRNPEAILWSGVFNIRPQLTFSRQRTEVRTEAAAVVAERHV